MAKMRVIFVLAFMAFASMASAQEMKKGDKAWTELEATLRDTNLRWLCQGKYYKPKRQDCVDARAKFWADQFFEMGQGSGTQTKAQMVAGQTAGAKTYSEVVRGEGPNPTDFKLMAVYGNFAMAADHTSFKTRLDRAGKPDFVHGPANSDTGHWFLDDTGKLAVVREVTFLRLFVKENGEWRPAAGASVPVPPTK